MSVEEAAFRIPGYLAAFRATGRTVYRERAFAAGDYLLRERVFADGHILLQGHPSIDFAYSAVGRALIELWQTDQTRVDFLDAARRIGEQLMRYPISGSANHACISAQLLAPLYRITGEVRFRKSYLSRVFRHIPFQLNAGHWPGYNEYLWYQSIILRSLVDAYVVLPFTPEFTSRKDRLAKSITAAANWFIANQKPDGRFPLMSNTPPAGFAENEVVSFDGNEFAPASIEGGYRGHGGYELDALISVVERLGAVEFAPMIHGYAKALMATGLLWRLEFNTMAAGRYIGFLADVANDPPAARRFPDAGRN